MVGVGVGMKRGAGVVLLIVGFPSCPQFSEFSAAVLFRRWRASRTGMETLEVGVGMEGELEEAEFRRETIFEALPMTRGSLGSRFGSMALG